MAQRRMFSSEVVDTDDFLSMPLTTQALYFHLGLNADDEGFVTPRFIMRKIGSNEDDIKLLVAKGFVIPFEDRVVVITHWKINNYLQSDRTKPTQYQIYKSSITCDVSKMYTKCIPTNQLTNQPTNGGANRKFLMEQGMDQFYKNNK